MIQLKGFYEPVKPAEWVRVLARVCGRGGGTFTAMGEGGPNSTLRE